MTERLLKMMSVEGFNSVFESELKLNATETYEHIFNRLNCEYKEAFGVYRYANNDSFKRIRRRFLKK